MQFLSVLSWSYQALVWSLPKFLGCVQLCSAANYETISSIIKTWKPWITARLKCVSFIEKLRTGETIILMVWNVVLHLIIHSNLWLSMLSVCFTRTMELKKSHQMFNTRCLPLATTAIHICTHTHTQTEFFHLLLQSVPLNWGCSWNSRNLNKRVSLSL